jgi:hypothetical protein
MLNLRVKLVQSFVYFGLCGTLKNYFIMKKNGRLDDQNEFRIAIEISHNLSYLMSSRKLRRIYDIYQEQLVQ